MSKDEINNLAKLLTMKSNNIESIKNILRYLDKLAEFPIFPGYQDINPYIALKVAEIKILSSSFQDVIKLFKDNKLLRKFIYDNMEVIIKHNISDNLHYLHEKGDVILSYFIFELLKLKEITLAKQALKLGSKFDYNYDEIPPLIISLTSYVLRSKDVDLIKIYFHMSLYINYIYNDNHMNLDFIIGYIRHKIYNDIRDSISDDIRNSISDEEYRLIIKEEYENVLQTIYQVAIKDEIIELARFLYRHLKDV